MTNCENCLTSQKEVENLRKENENLRKENEILRQELEKIRKEFNEYKLRHPKTVGVKHGKPYSIKPSVIRKEHKKPGAKPGHEPHNRPRPTSIDETRRVSVEICPHCKGRELSGVQEVRERIIEDIPECRPIVKKLEIERRYCRNCQKLVETPVTDALPNAKIGIRLMLVVTFLKIGLRVTEEAIPKLLWALFKFRISEGEVILILSQVEKAFGVYYKKLVKEIRAAKVRKMDETSWRIQGINSWLWTFVSKGVVLYKIAYSRTHEIPLEVLGSEPKDGVDIHDGFSAYSTFAKKTGRKQQLCWAHIIRNAKELEEFYGEEGAIIHKAVKKVYEDAKSLEHKGTEEDIKRLQHRLEFEIERDYNSSHCRRFVKNLLKEKDKLFVFVTNPEVDSTNNETERELRHGVIARKISGGNRSDRGARIYERLLSVFQTVKRKGEDFLSYGQKILLTSHG